MSSAAGLVGDRRFSHSRGHDGSDVRFYYQEFPGGSWGFLGIPRVCSRALFRGFKVTFNGLEGTVEALVTQCGTLCGVVHIAQGSSWKKLVRSWEIYRCRKPMALENGYCCCLPGYQHHQEYTQRRTSVAQDASWIYPKPHVPGASGTVASSPSSNLHFIVEPPAYSLTVPANQPDLPNRHNTLLPVSGGCSGGGGGCSGRWSP